MSKTWGEIREEALRRCGQLPPKTNADRIRAMSDEDLARWLDRIRLCCDNDLCGRSCPLADVCYSTGAPKEMIDWLKEEGDTDD